MRGRLIAVAVAITSMVVIAFLVPLAMLTRDLSADRERTAAERDAESLARLLVVLPSPADPAALATLIGPDAALNGRPVSIILDDGTVIGAPLDADEDLSPAFGGSTFRQPVAGGEAVYVPVLTGEGTFVVRIVASGDAMRAGVTRAWVILGTLGVVLVLLAVSVADRLGRSMVQPVEELSDAAHALGSGDLDTRIDPSGPPEVRDVGMAFNRLAIQVEGLLQQERDDAADLAHRLRTPLTALRLNAEALPDDERRTAILEQLDDLERVVDHVISEARRPARQTMEGSCDAAAVLAERAAFWEPLAADEGRSLSVSGSDGPAAVGVTAADLGAAIDALIGNVFAHTSGGTDLSLRLDVVHGEAHIVIGDGGTGFPPEIDPTDRGASGVESTGLGLDIARRTAEAGGGTLTIAESPEGGAEVTLAIPFEIGVVSP